ncbi:hypothetical protein [Nocardia flavorosea]|uniref:hypothetical protein n=1 Tax=Nocardia flavorosea TaxID=53429 RepID=UPI0024568CE5|nr:hypothetical protein [Nocardia flavorosea]
MAVTNPLTHSDLLPFQPNITETMSGAMISSVWSRARKAVPQLTDPELSLGADDTELLRTVLRSAVLRWFDGGSGAVYQRGAGDFSETLRASGMGGTFTREELSELRSLAGLEPGGASTILTYPLPEALTSHPFVAPEGI